MNTNTDSDLVLERTFDAPRDVLWRMWTEPEQFGAWYGPEGATLPVVEMDVRVGGARLVCMDIVTPAGPMVMWFAGEFTEVVDLQRLVYTEFASDENGAPRLESDAHGAGVTEVRVEFHDTAEGTLIVLTHRGIPSDSPGAAGWSAAFDKLAERVGVH